MRTTGLHLPETGSRDHGGKHRVSRVHAWKHRVNRPLTFQLASVRS